MIFVVSVAYGDSVDDGFIAYEKGDFKKAFQIFQQQAQKGIVKAQYSLGVYDKGKGVPRDYKEAVKWYRLAADQGYALAKCNLAHLYAKGLGTAKDTTMAKKLAREGYEAGENALEKYGTKTICQISEKKLFRGEKKKLALPSTHL